MDQNNLKPNDESIIKPVEAEEKENDPQLEKSYQDILDKYAQEVAKQPQQPATDPLSTPAQPLVIEPTPKVEPTNQIETQQVPAEPQLLQETATDLAPEEKTENTMAVPPENDIVPAAQETNEITSKPEVSPVVTETPTPKPDSTPPQVEINSSLKSNDNISLLNKESTVPPVPAPDTTPPPSVENLDTKPNFDLESSPLPARDEDDNPTPSADLTVPNSQPENPPTNPPVAGVLPNQPQSKPSGGGLFKVLFILSVLVFLIVVGANAYSLITSKPVPIPFFSPDDPQEIEEIVTDSPENIPTIVSAGSCILNGTQYAVGESFDAVDGCNTCTCQETLEVVCTEIACDNSLVEEDENTDVDVKGSTSLPQ